VALQADVRAVEVRPVVVEEPVTEGQERLPGLRTLALAPVVVNGSRSVDVRHGAAPATSCDLDAVHARGSKRVEFGPHKPATLPRWRES